jgi:yecA family protein
MLPPKEEKILKKFLALATEPEETLSYDELLGYLFGLAMTPDVVLPSEWIPMIFGGEGPTYKSMKQMEEMTGCLTTIYNRFVASFQAGQLDFPIDITTMDDQQIVTIYEWVSGLEEALALRDELWDPEQFPKLAKTKKEELYYSLMIVQGLVEPDQVMDFFANMPDEFLREAFPGMDAETIDRDMQIQVFLMASLPLAVQTLQNHARMIEEKRRKSGRRPIQLPIMKTKAVQNGGCQCGGPCGNSNSAKAPAESKKSNVIKVNFPQHGKKKTGPPAPIYQLKIALQGAKPPIWRRVLVPGNLTLEQLHKVIQLCMGWTDSHLHQFLVDRTCYCLPDEDDSWRTSRPKNEAKFTLKALEEKILPGFIYIYDYGDDWVHQIRVEKVLDPAEGKPYPVLIAGKRACPPDDIGGVPGYLHLLEVLADPEDEEYQEFVDWLDENFAPDRFGKEEIALINVVLEEIYS